MKLSKDWLAKDTAEVCMAAADQGAVSHERREEEPQVRMSHLRGKIEKDSKDMSTVLEK